MFRCSYIEAPMTHSAACSREALHEQPCDDGKTAATWAPVKLSELSETNRFPSLRACRAPHDQRGTSVAETVGETIEN